MEKTFVDNQWHEEKLTLTEYNAFISKRNWECWILDKKQNHTNYSQNEHIKRYEWFITWSFEDNEQHVCQYIHKLHIEMFVYITVYLCVPRHIKSYKNILYFLYMLS